LHEHRIFFGDASGTDDAINPATPYSLKRSMNRAGAEGGRLDQRAVRFRRRGRERLAEDEAGEPLIDEDGAVAVVPNRVRAGRSRRARVSWRLW